MKHAFFFCSQAIFSSVFFFTFVLLFILKYVSNQVLSIQVRVFRHEGEKWRPELEQARGEVSFKRISGPDNYYSLG